ncbi:MAG: FeoC like transcriptional regulator [Alphaproteobacteria bacterium ADurb.Bin438]|nr:MAG: FeoC like transcriptional regulator [Alphaproteobacteria bacterium ADurb.Bin438]
MIMDIKQYIKDVKKTSLKSISIHFMSDVKVVEDILVKLIKKGYVKEVKSACSDCSSSCKKECDRYFEWVD